MQKKNNFKLSIGQLTDGWLGSLLLLCDGVCVNIIFWDYSRGLNVYPSWLSS